MTKTQIRKTSIKNFFRALAGKPKQFPIKVERDERAKEFPMISIKKDGDVGFDLVSVGDVVIPAMTEENRKRYFELLENGATDEEVEACLPRGVIPTGIKIEMTNDVWCTIEARSSASSKGLITPDSIIDSGYRGELFSVVFNLGYEEYVINKGERVAQVIFHERIEMDIEEVAQVGESDRGTTGFGSTGV